MASERSAKGDEEEEEAEEEGEEGEKGDEGEEGGEETILMEEWPVGIPSFEGGEVEGSDTEKYRLGKSSTSKVP